LSDEKISFPEGMAFTRSVRDVLDTIQDGLFLVDAETRVLFWSRGAERITGIGRDDATGKRCSELGHHPVDESAKILCETNCPVKKVFSKKNPNAVETYFRHKEGYRLPVALRALPLPERDGTITAAAAVFADVSPRFLLPFGRSELENMKLIDTLTGSGNDKFLKMHIQTRLEEMKRYRIPFGLIYVDIDHLKEVNEAYGKAAGDRILSTAAQTLAKNIRFFDTLGRWASDEFLIVALNVDENKLDFVANKLRLLVEQSSFAADTHLLKVTCSAGATLARRVDDVETLVARAHSLMMSSKWKGRNRVSVGLEAVENRT